MNVEFERLGMLIDDLESLCCGLNIPMSADFHVEQLKEILPKKVQQFKEVFENLTGENPWD
jgi:hypothetical protein